VPTHQPQLKEALANLVRDIRFAFDATPEKFELFLTLPLASSPLQYLNLPMLAKYAHGIHIITHNYLQVVQHVYFYADPKDTLKYASDGSLTYSLARMKQSIPSILKLVSSDKLFLGTLAYRSNAVEDDRRQIKEILEYAKGQCFGGITVAYMHYDFNSQIVREALHHVLLTIQRKCTFPALHFQRPCKRISCERLISTYLIKTVALNRRFGTYYADKNTKIKEWNPMELSVYTDIVFASFFYTHEGSPSYNLNEEHNELLDHSQDLREAHPKLRRHVRLIVPGYRTFVLSEMISFEASIHVPDIPHRIRFPYCF
jgi:hypothetical protein